MRRICAVLAGLLLASTALAGTLNWFRPTTYSDGQPLPASAITGYEFRCQAATTTAGILCSTVTVAGTLTTTTITVTVPSSGGTACVEGRAFAGANNASVWAGGTGAACMTFAPTPPGPPTNITLTVLIVPDVFEWQVRSSKLRLIKVGNGTLGAECGDEVAAPFYEVPASAVVTTTAYRGGRLIGVCLAPPAA
jgi:hypothetical protein